MEDVRCLLHKANTLHPPPEGRDFTVRLDKDKEKFLRKAISIINNLKCQPIIHVTGPKPMKDFSILKDFREEVISLLIRQNLKEILVV